jgi:hypothetical protein
MTDLSLLAMSKPETAEVTLQPTGESYMDRPVAVVVDFT